MAEQVTKHKLPPEKGAGSVVLYEVKAGHTPPMVTNPQDIEDKRWVLVLFPERWGWVAKSRASGTREAKGDSATLAALLLKRTIKTKKKTKSKKKKATEKPESAKKEAGVVRTCAHTKREERPEHKAESAEATSKDDEESDEEKPKERPEIPATATFDQALDIRFPVERLMDELEDLMTASIPLYSKEGEYVGDKPDFMTRMAAVKTAISYREGLARAREKEMGEPKRISFDELEKMLLENPLACETLERVIKKARSHQAMSKAGVGVAKQQPKAT